MTSPGLQFYKRVWLLLAISQDLQASWRSCSTTQLQLHLRSVYCCKDQSLSGKKPCSYVHEKQAVIWLSVETGFDDKSGSDICWPVKSTQEPMSAAEFVLNDFLLA